MPSTGLAPCFARLARGVAEAPCTDESSESRLPEDVENEEACTVGLGSCVDGATGICIAVLTSTTGVIFLSAKAATVEKRSLLGAGKISLELAWRLLARPLA